MTKSEIAWATGLFEGEGCFYFSGGSRQRLANAGLAMTDEDVVIKFGNVVGFGNISGPTKRGSNKPVWLWNAAAFEYFQQLVCYFWSYLGIRRKNKVKEVLNRYHSRKMKEFHKKKRQFTRLPKWAVTEIKDLLKRGETQRAIADKFGVSRGLISRISTNHRHRGAL